MLNQIKLFFEQHLALSAPENASEEKLQLATVVLFLEMMNMDDKVEAVEQDIIFSLIASNFIYKNIHLIIRSPLIGFSTCNWSPG